LKAKLTIERRRALRGLMFVSPFIVGVLVFFIYPLIVSIRLSVSKLEIKGFQMAFDGFDNYRRAFMVDKDFVTKFLYSLTNMAQYTPLIVIFSLILAILISRRFKFRAVFRVIFFLPFLLGTGLVMQYLLGQGISGKSLDISRGIIVPEQIMLTFGSAVSNAVSQYLNLISMALWQSGVQVLLFLSGIQSIPLSLYESAKCDGATEWESFWKITLPMLSPIILLNIVFTIVTSFTDITNAVMDYIYQIAFKSAAPQYEYSAALGWIYFAVVIVVIGAVFLAMGKFVKNVSGARERGVVK